MTDVDIVHVLRMMCVTGVKVGGPILATILAVGIVVSLVQTITQIQEQAVVYVLKFCAVGAVLLVMGPWMLQELSGFVHNLWAKVPEVR
jgi:flagellar biosynthetic protein FliQ